MNKPDGPDRKKDMEAVAPNPMAAMAGYIKRACDNWLMQLELIDFQSKIVKARYDAALAQGFTEKQALEICTKNWEL